MAEQTGIEWCDSTFNPWIGCARVSPACDHCYAARSTPARTMGIAWGAGEPRRRTSASTWAQPVAWQRQAAAFHAVHGRRRRVFCASLADVFDNEVPDLWRWDLFQLIKATPDLDWLLLTKRIGNVARMLPNIAPDALGAAYPNVWLGITVVNQEEADRDIPKLMNIRARGRFLSMEPLLGPVNLGLMTYGEAAERAGSGRVLTTRRRALDWVIVGGESGPKARPMHPDWAYSLRDQCAAAGVPFMFKQVGEWASPGMRAFGTVNGEVSHINSAGQFLDPPPDDENADCLTIVRVGKKAAGRLLGGIEHNGFPQPWAES